MKNYKLHYADLILNGDISVYEFKTFDELVDYANFKTREKKGECVFLIAKDYQTTKPFITDNPFDIEFFLTKMPGMGFKSDTFIQEYNSFEEAYKVALTICEKSELCYS
jgi:hypothetical protein